MTVTNIYEIFTGQAVSSTLLCIISVKHHNRPRREVVFTSFYRKEREKKKLREVTQRLDSVQSFVGFN